MDEPIIRVRNLGCQSGDRFLLKNIQWEIPDKSRWIILGTNGCGKTTLLSVLSGYQDYTHGELFYKGVNYRDMDILELRKKMGLVSNSYFDRVYHNESVQDLILAGVSGTLGLEKEEIRPEHIRKVKRLLDLIGLPEKLEYPYNSMSKGERQNILILRAMLAQPEVMVLDEPMTGLDVVSKEKMMRFVRGIARENSKTMLYVTHHFEEISPELFDRCLLMRRGQIYATGTVEEMMQSDVIGDFLKKPVQVHQMKNGYYQLNYPD